MGNAGRFARAYRDQLLFVDGEWLKWDGRQWAQANDVELQELGKKVVRQMFLDAVAVSRHSQSKVRVAWAFKSESIQRIRAMIDLARGELALPGERLDADQWLLNVKNGTIDLRSGMLHDHTPSDYITKLAPVIYDPSAACPRWLAFLNRIFDKETGHWTPYSALSATR